MKSNIYIPSKIRVGYQERSDTYTKRLAYVIYFDEKGKLRKEASWKSWCQLEDVYAREWIQGTGYVNTNKLQKAALPVDDYKNEPTEGFVLNKKVGGHKSDWNFRNAYCRVYDPRGFEFEITVENLLYILENTSSIKGKGLEGKFVYGWYGKKLVLLPESAPEFQEQMKYSKELKTRISARDLKLGQVYIDNKQRRVVYLGKFETFEDRRYSSKKVVGESLGKKFWFIPESSTLTPSVETYSSCPHLIEDTGEVWPLYANCMDALQHDNKMYPIDPKVTEEVPVDENVQIFNRYDDYFFTRLGNLLIRYCIDTNGYWNKKIRLQHIDIIQSDLFFGPPYSNSNNSLPIKEFDSLKEVFETYPSFKIKQFLTNGKEYKRYSDFKTTEANS